MADFEGQDFDSLPAGGHTPLTMAPASSEVPSHINNLEGADFDALTDDSEKYGTTGQMVKTAAESAAQGLLGPLAPAVETHVLGVNPEDIRARQEANPITHVAGEAVGLGAGLLTGTGQAGLMTKAGEAAAGLAGLANVAREAPLITRIGSSAIQQAAEMAVLQSGDEASKLILNDPEASAESAIANIGMAAALGAGGGAFITGAVSPLWKATVGDKAEAFLNSLTSKMGGVEGVASDAANLAAKSGLEIPAEMAAKIDNVPGAAEMFSKLSQTDTTKAGRTLQEVHSKFMDDLSGKMVETLGHETGYLEKLPELDKYTAGQKLADTLHDDLAAEARPINDAYDKINAQFKDTPVSITNLQQISDDIARKAVEKGWIKAESDAQMKFMENTLKKLPEQETAEDLKKFLTNLRDNHPFGKDTYAAARDVSKIIKEGQERAITEGILAKGGEGMKVEEYNALKSRYAQYMDTLDSLNEHLHVGRYDGPKTFLAALKDLGSTSGEAVLNRLSGANKAQILDVLRQVSPNALNEVRQYQVNKLLSSSLNPAGQLSPSKLSTNLGKLSPQLRDLLLTPENKAQMEALSEIAEKLKDSTHNWSNTARTIDKITHGSFTPLTLLAALTGHGVAGVVTHLGGLGMVEGRDAVKLGMLRFLGSSQPVKSEGFKSMVSFIQNSMKGTNLLSKATKAVFESGSKVLSADMMPAKADLEKLDKTVEAIQNAPGKAQELQNGHLGHYLPEHQSGITEASLRAAQYLQTIKPQPKRMSPLGREIEPTYAEKARYNRALTIAQQPAVTLQWLKNGTLQASDIQDLGAMYPGLYKHMAAEVSNNMTNRKHDEEPIPYKTRMGLSLFLGQPLDQTMEPESMQRTQLTYTPQPLPSAAQPTKKGTSALEKTAKSYMTPSQSSEAHKAEHK